MLGFALLLKSLVQKMRNSINESPVYASFSYISASKPVGRIDPSRFETVNSASPVRRPGARKLQWSPPYTPWLPWQMLP